ncbi:hypothetical protein [Halodesulfovibrio sp. MK-HDV]|uniref:hypothetical protein n=1 Tax=Halodesulfovibrio sp. MK-HDV TaxID=2599925 RepID=UPI00136E4016|nr:hypothetical protein [Halodesulfovibrio sp. MK-HDV]KAF1073608.1 hypothetical protein MKHDV_03450 [Halodesulfovibrio sp. MK-HDV]
MEIELLFTTGVLSAGIAALVAGLNVSKTISAQNVTQERKLWRETIRKLTLEVHDALSNGDEQKLLKLRTSFTNLLNLTHYEDRKLIACIELGGDVGKKQNEFAERISFLLKHDWERVKHEVSFYSKFLYHEPKRVSYDDWKCDPEMCTCSKDKRALYAIVSVPYCFIFDRVNSFAEKQAAFFLKLDNKAEKK